MVSQEAASSYHDIVKELVDLGIGQLASSRMRIRTPGEILAVELVVSCQTWTLCVGY